MRGKPKVSRRAAASVVGVAAVGAVATTIALRSPAYAGSSDPVVLGSGTERSGSWTVAAWNEDGSLCMAILTVAGSTPPTAAATKSRPGTAGCGFNGNPSGGRTIGISLDPGDTTVLAGPVSRDATGYRIDGRTIANLSLTAHTCPPVASSCTSPRTQPRATDRTHGYPVDSSGQRAPEQDFD